MTLPPLDAFARATTNLTHIEVHAVEPRADATLVRLSNWMRGVQVETPGPTWREADRLTALHRWTPELLGRSAGWSVRLREPGRPAADVPVQRDVPLVQAALDRGLAEPMMRSPLGGRVTRRAEGLRDAEADGAIGLDYRAGHLVARVRSHEDGAAEIAQLEAVLAAAVALLDELAPPPEPVDAEFGPDKPRDIRPGAASVDEAAEWMRGPRRFLRGREAPTPEAALSAFAASYGGAWLPRGVRAPCASRAAALRRAGADRRRRGSTLRSSFSLSGSGRPGASRARGGARRRGAPRRCGRR